MNDILRQTNFNSYFWKNARTISCQTLTLPVFLFVNVMVLGMALIYFAFGMDSSVLLLLVVLLIVPMLYVSSRTLADKSQFLIRWYHYLGAGLTFLTCLISLFFHNIWVDGSFAFTQIDRGIYLFVILTTVIQLGWAYLHVSKLFHHSVNPFVEYVLFLYSLEVIILLITIIKLAEHVFESYVDTYFILDSIFLLGLILLTYKSYILTNFLKTGIKKGLQGEVFDITENGKLNGEDRMEKFSTSLNLENKSRELEAVLESEQLFLNPFLSLDLLSEKSGIPKHHLSHIFNTYFEGGFYQMIGDYRIRHAMKIMKEDPTTSLETLLDSCGFSSRSTFYKYFKKMNGCTPASFLKTLSDAKEKNEVESFEKS